MIKQLHHIKIIACIMLLSVTGCKKFVDTGNPRTSLTGETVFNSAATATAAVTGIYGRMYSPAGYFASGTNYSISFLAGLSADEWKLVMSDPEQEQFNNNALTSFNSILSLSQWNEMYQYIYTANEIIGKIQGSKNIPQPVKDQLEGEALFIRAFGHFYLLNLYGAIPLALSTDHTINAKLQRSPVTEVYTQITADLEKAAILMSEDYMNERNEAGNERVRPNRSAANALLARAYVYNGEWTKAEAMATQVIDNTKYSLSPLDNVFLANSDEAIWQLQPVYPGLNTWEGYYYQQPFSPWLGILQPSLMNAFENGDARKTSWTITDSTGDPYAYPYKYKIQFGDDVTEYSMVLRLAEQYLVRAEARIQQDNNTGGIEDINVIRSRAQLPGLSTALTKEQALDAVLQERQVELFTEWGHRWFDLKRSGKINDILPAAKGTSWQPTDALYPIPQTELDKNVMLQQNEGY